MGNRTRNEQLIVRVTPEEKVLIEKRMKEVGIHIFSRYARKMLLNGYVIQVDLSTFQKLANEVNKVGVNINQIARKENATNMICADDMIRLREMTEEVWQLLKSFLSALLSKIR